MDQGRPSGRPSCMQERTLGAPNLDDKDIVVHKGRAAMKKTLAVMTVLGLLLGALAAPSATAAKKKKKKSGPVVMGTDPAGDWGANSAQTGRRLAMPSGKTSWRPRSRWPTRRPSTSSSS